MSFFRVIVNLFHFNRTNWKAVTLCFLAAVVFWFFNSLNKNYSTNLKFPIQFQYDQERYVPVNALPEAVFMNVSGNGWDLLRKSLGFNLPEMRIALERPTEIKKIVGSTLPALLAGQLGNLQINHVVTDTLYLQVDPKEKKKFRVVADPEKFQFAEGFGRLSPIVVLPDSVELTGPKSLLAELPDSILLNVGDNRINKDFKEEVEVDIPYGDRLSRNPPTVEVIFEVVEWEEITKRLQLTVENAPPGIRLNLVNDSVSCTIRIPKQRVEEFRSSSEGQIAVADVGDLRRGERKVLPSIAGLPAYAKVLHVDSVAIKLY